MKRPRLKSAASTELDAWTPPVQDREGARCLEQQTTPLATPEDMKRQNCAIMYNQGSCPEPDEEKDVVQDIAPKAGARLMGIRSKYSLLDATVEVVRRVSDKGLLATWSASIIMKDAEARAMWNMAWPKMYRDLDARSEPGDEGDPPSTANQQEERPRGDTDQTEMKKVLALLESLHDLNIPEEDRLQALVAEEYEDEIDMAILLLPATGIYSALRKRITEATRSEVKWWAKVLVKYVRYVRRDRVEEEDKARAQRAKEAEHTKQQDRDRAQARKWSPKKSSTPTERSRKYAKNNQGAAQRVILPDDTNKTDGDEDVEEQAEEVQDNLKPPSVPWQCSSRYPYRSVENG